MQFGRLSRREFGKLLGSAAMWPLAAGAQQPMVGFLSIGSAGDVPRALAAFQQGLSRAGAVEGQNVVVEYRWAERADGLSELATGLVRGEAAVIVAPTHRAAFAAKTATQTIPIVFVSTSDPADLVANFSQPAGNVTGVSCFQSGLEVKRLELLRELVPNVGTVGVLVSSDRGNPAPEVKTMQSAARVVGQQVQILTAGSAAEIDAAFQRFSRLRIGALLVNAVGPLFMTLRDRVVAWANGNAVPALYDLREFPAAGGLISYGPSLTDAYRQMGDYAGKILQGTKVGDLPVVQPTKLELVINLTTVKALGFAVPAALQGRADELLK